MADLYDGIGNFVGITSAQYKLAIDLVARVSILSNGQVTLVGHSLGGSLATVAGLNTDFDVFTFNTAATHVKWMFQASTYSGKITNFRSFSDGLQLINFSRGVNVFVPGETRYVFGGGFHGIVALCNAMGGGC